MSLGVAKSPSEHALCLPGRRCPAKRVWSGADVSPKTGEPRIVSGRGEEGNGKGVNMIFSRKRMKPPGRNRWRVVTNSRKIIPGFPNFLTTPVFPDEKRVAVWAPSRLRKIQWGCSRVAQGGINLWNKLIFHFRIDYAVRWSAYSFTRRMLLTFLEPGIYDGNQTFHKSVFYLIRWKHQSTRTEESPYRSFIFNQTCRWLCFQKIKIFFSTYNWQTSQFKNVYTSLTWTGTVGIYDLEKCASYSNYS